MATMKPSHVIVAKNPAEYGRLKVHLLAIGYPVGVGVNATRVDKDSTRTITITYHDWDLKV